MSSRFYFYNRWVTSSLEGVSLSCPRFLLQARGYSVILRKLDPYLNIDPGTLSPYEQWGKFL